MIKELRSSDPVSVGPYRLLGRLGVGGMGQVYLARSRGGRLVAIKVIRPELAEERGFRARFASEIAAARNVSGMYTAAVVDSDPEAEMPWMATAYVPGPSLADAIYDDGALPIKTVLALAAGLAEALVAIHEAGVVHRDLKPSNVLLAADGPRVIDFGISLAIERSMLTTTGVVMGSPGFMSPEQARGVREVGKPTDVFSLGAVLAFAATGDGPFGGGSTPALLYRVVNEAPDLARVPARVRPLIEHCLAKDPADRPTPAEILGQLGDEVGVLTGEWLPKAVADTIGRYIPTIETAMPPAPPAPSAPEPSQPADVPAEADPQADPEEIAAAPLTADEPATPELMIAAAGISDTTDLVVAAQAPDDRSAATQDMALSAATTNAVAAAPGASPATQARQGHGEALPSAPAAGALDQLPVPPDGDALVPPDGDALSAPDGDALSRPPEGVVRPLRRWRWPASVAAAVVVVAAVATILAIEPGGGTPKTTAGPTTSLVRTTKRPTARPTTTATPSKTPTAAKTKKKPTSKKSKTTHRTQSNPTPTPGETPSQTQAPTDTSSTPSGVTTTTQPPPVQHTTATTTAAAGPQTITGVSGATSQSCSAYGSISSASGGSGVGFTFTNDSDADIQVWFLTSGGSGSLVGTVAPGSSSSPGVDTGQDWMVANSGGGCIGIFTITSSGGVTAGS